MDLKNNRIEECSWYVVRIMARQQIVRLTKKDHDVGDPLTLDLPSVR